MNDFVMSDSKDPFNLTAGRVRNAEWVKKYFEELIIPHLEAEKIPNIHIRDIHYVLQGENLNRPNGKEYLNDSQSWNFLVDSMRDARLLRLVPYEKIRDNKNRASINIRTGDHESLEGNIENANDKLTYEGVLESSKSQFGLMMNRALFQNYWIEFWTEKTLPILEQVATAYGLLTNLVEGEGEMSLTQIFDLCNRAVIYNRPIRIGYLGDFDVIGINLARSFSRKLEYIIRTYEEFNDLDIRVQRLMLLPDQVREYDLPLQPMKTSTGKKKGYETRKEKFYEEHGLIGAVELNTIHVKQSTYFRKVLTDFILQYYDSEPNNSARRMQESITKKADELLHEQIGEFELEDMDWSTLEELYKPDEIEYTKDVEEIDDEWLFDSKRTPEDQRPYYEEV